MHTRPIFYSPVLSELLFSCVAAVSRAGGRGASVPDAAVLPQLRASRRPDFQRLSGADLAVRTRAPTPPATAQHRARPRATGSGVSICEGRKSRRVFCLQPYAQICPGNEHRDPYSTDVHTRRSTRKETTVLSVYSDIEVSHQHTQALSSKEFRDLASTESSRRSHIYSPTISLSLTECPSRWNEYVHLRFVARGG